MTLPRDLDDAIRREPICRGCGKAKHQDDYLLVCWHCFKFRETCLKYFRGGFDSWLTAIGQREFTSTNCPPLMPATASGNLVEAITEGGAK